jgi:hypothetical protein
MSEAFNHPACRKCGQRARGFQRVETFDRLRLADDLRDPNCGHVYLETVYILGCLTCGYRQEHLHQRTPYPTLREAQREMEAHLLGKG